MLDAYIIESIRQQKDSDDQRIPVRIPVPPPLPPSPDEQLGEDEDESENPYEVDFAV